MRVIYFTKYSRMGASSRLRSYQFFPLLESKGYSVKVFNLFNDKYLELLYSGKSSKLLIIRRYIVRFFQLFKLKKSNIIVIEKELFPYFPAFFEIILKKLGFKFFVDYDDAIFHNYDLSKSIFIKFFLKNKIDLVMKNSFCVFAGNSYLANRAKNAGSSRVTILPTVIDLNRYSVKSYMKEEDKIVIGWIGSPTTFKYVYSLKGLFDVLYKKYNFELHIIGASNQKTFSKYAKFIEWSEKTEVDCIKQFDIGIMPLENSVWEKGKCAYKLIQYMACGIPVLASGVGMNNDLVVNGVEGFLCFNEDDWNKNLQYLIKNKIEELGKNGRLKVEKTYNTNVNIEIIVNEFNNSLQ